jgi:hypothetical protein
VKHYIPQPGGRWGAVFSVDREASKPALVLLAAGKRHPPRPWKFGEARQDATNREQDGFTKR